MGKYFILLGHLRVSSEINKWPSVIKRVILKPMCQLCAITVMPPRSLSLSDLECDVATVLRSARLASEARMVRSSLGSRPDVSRGTLPSCQS